nr:MAG TPA: hypothetical protein [Caudoviricetes sp.]DAP78622.1 MAG TPA: hypothetical protein [Caudoviricetes sp.]DAU65029.1 MAG TPA: hypothetical protein [Caudoviricetes sp.]
MEQYQLMVGNRYSKQSREVCAQKLLTTAFLS